MAAPSPFLVLSPCISGDARQAERKSPPLASPPARHAFGQRADPKTKTPASAYADDDDSYRSPKARALKNWLDKLPLPAPDQGSTGDNSTYNILSTTTHHDNDRAGTAIPQKSPRYAVGPLEARPSRAQRPQEWYQQDQIMIKYQTGKH